MAYSLSLISIHVLREEGDVGDGVLDAGVHPISIHALREEGDIDLLLPAFAGLFLSTPSARRATSEPSVRCRPDRYFYPRPPRGGRHLRRAAAHCPAGHFYPRPPQGGRPHRLPRMPSTHSISIHALRKEGDFFGVVCWSASAYFYPRPPQGGRRCIPPDRFKHFLFLSTPSARRATRLHTARHECWKFLSTPSARRATVQALPRPQPPSISIHALRKEGDPLRGFFSRRGL